MGTNRKRASFADAGAAMRSSIDAALGASNLSLGEARVLLVIIREIGTYSRIEDGLARQRIADVAGVSTRTVSSALQRLEHRGAISYTPGGGAGRGRGRLTRIRLGKARVDGEAQTSLTSALVGEALASPSSSVEGEARSTVREKPELPTTEKASEKNPPHAPDAQVCSTTSGDRSGDSCVAQSDPALAGAQDVLRMLAPAFSVANAERLRTAAQDKPTRAVLHIRDVVAAGWSPSALHRLIRSEIGNPERVREPVPYIAKVARNVTAGAEPPADATPGSRQGVYAEQLARWAYRTEGDSRELLSGLPEVERDPSLEAAAQMALAALEAATQ